MAITVDIGGVNYSVPEQGERSWGQGTSDLLVALSTASYQIRGGSIPLDSEADFGLTAGLKSLWFSSQTANPASTGVIRLANLDEINWRTADTFGNNILTVDGSDELTYNGTKVAVITDIPVDSVHGRTGAVVSDTNDYSWAQIDKTVSDLADITTKSHISLTDVGTNTHAQIDTHISDTTNPHSVTAAQVGLGNVDNTSDLTKDAATATLTNKTIDADNNTITNIGTTELEDDISFPGEGAIGLPDGTTAQRPTPVNGMLRYNTEDGSFEGVADGAWGAIGGGGLEIVNIDDTNSPVTAEIGKQYQVDTTAGVVVINLPDLSALSASEQPTAVISVVDCGSNAAVNNITVNAFAGDSIDFQDDTNDTSLVIDMQGQSVGFGRATDTTWCQVSGLQPSAVGSVLTNSGDLLSHDGTGSNRVAVGTTGQILTSNGTDIVWEDAASGSGKNYVQNPSAGADATTGVSNTTAGTWTIARTTTASELPEETLGTAYKISGSGLTAGDTVEWAIAATGIDDSDGGRFGRARVAVKDISTTINGEYSIQVYDVTNSVYVGDEDTITGTGTYYLDVPLVAANDYEFHLKAETASPTNIGLSSITIEPVSQTWANLGGWKSYDESDVTITGTNSWSTTNASITPYKDPVSGKWFARGNVRGTTSSASGSTVTVTGMTFPAWNQAGTVSTNTTATSNECYAIASTSNFKIEQGANRSSWWFSFDVELASKPTWADWDNTAPTASDVQYENARGRWYRNAAYSYTSNTTFAFDTEDTATFAPAVGISNASGVFTVSAAGTYNITSTLSASTSWAANTVIQVKVDRGSGLVTERTPGRVDSAGVSFWVGGNCTITLAAGDSFVITANSTETISVGTTNTCVEVTRVSDYSARKASLPFPNGTLFLGSGNGHGSPGTMIRRYNAVPVVDTGDAFTYVDSVTDGMSVTINRDMVASISVSDGYSGSNFYIGVSVNAPSLTTPIYNVANGVKLIMESSASSTYASTSVTIKLTKGDIIRAHFDGLPNETGNRSSFIIQELYRLG